MPAGAQTALTLPYRLALAAIVLLGALVRVWGLDTGVPFRMSADEPAVLSQSLRMIRTGDFHPYFFDYGGLTLYLHTAVGAFAFLSGASDGRWTSLDAFWEGDMLVAGRTVTALLGALTIVVVFFIGLRWGRTVALVSALVMAVLPAHVREAHFVLTDTPLTLLVAVTLLLAMRAVEAPRIGAVALAGLTAGMAAAVKYNGGAALIMPLTAALALPRGHRLRAMCAAVAACAGGFLAFAPYTILALPEFLNRLAALMQSYNSDRPMREVMRNYVAYLRGWFAWPGVLPLQIGYGALTLSVAGWGVMVARARDRRTWLLAGLVIPFPILYFWFMSSQTLQYGRYLLPLGPMLAVGLAVGATTVADFVAARLPRLRRVALPLLVTLLLAAPVASMIGWLRVHSRTTTVEQAAGWLVEHADRGDRVVMEDQFYIHMPPSLVLVRTKELVSRTVDDYRADDVTYLIVTSLRTDSYYRDVDAHQPQVAAHRTMLALTEPVATFVPTADHPGPTVTVLRIRR